MSPSSHRISHLLHEWSAGEERALEELTPLVYEELRRQAARYLRRERRGHTLQTTALIHEAYLRLVDARDMQWQGRAHFFAIAANLMRRILVDHARRRDAHKRGGDQGRLPLDRFVTETIGLDDVEDAFAKMQRGEVLRSVVVW